MSLFNINSLASTDALRSQETQSAATQTTPRLMGRTIAPPNTSSGPKPASNGWELPTTGLMSYFVNEELTKKIRELTFTVESLQKQNYELTSDKTALIAEVARLTTDKDVLFQQLQHAEKNKSACNEDLRKKLSDLVKNVHRLEGDKMLLHDSCHILSTQVSALVEQNSALQLLLNIRSNPAPVAT